jgi:hypothetical protein
VAIHERGLPAPLPVGLWTDVDALIVARAAARALRGAGDTTRHHTELGDVAFHLRRPMTPAEAASLPRRKHEPTVPIERATR